MNKFKIKNLITGVFILLAVTAMTFMLTQNVRQSSISTMQMDSFSYAKAPLTIDSNNYIQDNDYVQIQNNRAESIVNNKLNIKAQNLPVENDSKLASYSLISDEPTADEPTPYITDDNIGKREISGRIWVDKNNNGIIDNEEGIIDTLTNGLVVSLYKVNQSSQFEEAIDINENKVPNANIDANGNYKFTNLEPAIYVVKMQFNSNLYYLTTPKTGENETINSKFYNETEKIAITEYITELNSNSSEDIIKTNINAGFKMVLADIEEEVTIGGLKSISREMEIMPYVLNLDINIQNYVGDAKFSIIDTFPYKIDLTKSDLNGGVYDVEKNTVTWTQMEYGIDTYKNGAKIVTITKPLQIAYIDVNYGKSEIENTAIGKVELIQTSQELETEDVTIATQVDIKKDVTVKKNWVDTNNIYGKPKSVVVQVKNGDNIEGEQELSATNGWQYIFRGLKKYAEDGKQIDYTVAEKEVNTGDLKYYKATVDGTNITNTYIGPIISSKKSTTTENGKGYVIEGEKITYTVEVENAGGVQKDVIIKDNIPQGTSFVQNSIKINGATSSEKTANDLANGISVNVPAKENNINGKTVLSFDVTVNTLNTDIFSKNISNTASVDNKNTNTVTVSVNKANLKVSQKAFPDSGNKVKVGDEITYRIYLDNTNGTAPISATIKDIIPEGTTFVQDSIKIGNVGQNGIGQSELATGIDVNVAGGESKYIEFKVTVNKLTNGTVIRNSAQVNGLTTNEVTHTYTEAIISENKSVKTENGLNYVVNNEKITYTITINNSGDLAKDVIVKDTIPEGTTFVSGSIKINSIASPTQTKENLINGIRVNVAERSTATLSFDVKVNNNALANITNTATVDGRTTNTINIPTHIYVDVSVRKVWQDTDTQSARRPQSIILQLKSGNDVIKTQKITEKENWSYIFEKLDKYDNKGNEINYTISETEENKDDLRFYTQTLKGDMKTGYILTNTFSLPNDRISIPVKKVWDDNKNEHNKRPQSVEIQVKNGNDIAGTIELNEQNNWQYTFSNLAKYNQMGQEITYKVIEKTTNQFYDVNIIGNQTSGYTITNTFKVIEPKLNTVISQQANKTKITKENEEITYKVKYDVDITDYVGDATIKIVDKLPYEIDEETCMLDGGIYNKENKTITWEETIKDIDTFTNIVTGKITITKTFKVSYVNYKPTGTIKNEIVGTTTLDSTSKKDTKQADFTLETKTPAKVIVQHFVQGTDNKIIQDQTLNGILGQEYKIEPSKEVLIDYDVVSKPASETGKYTAETQYISYYYKKKKGKLLVKHVDVDSGKDIYEAENFEQEIGEDYNTKPKTINYYKLVQEKYPSNCNGQYSKGTTTVTYYYKKLSFNMEVNKQIESLIINGETKQVSKNIAKIDIKDKQVKDTTIQAIYSIKVKNIGEIEGSIELEDSIPEGFKINEEKNSGWTVDENKAKLTSKVLKPGEEVSYTIILDWIVDTENFGQKTNVVRITKTNNPAGFSDIETENNESKADIILTIKTGINNVLLNKMILVIAIVILISGTVALSIDKTKKENE